MLPQRIPLDIERQRALRAAHDLWFAKASAEERGAAAHIQVWLGTAKSENAVLAAVSRLKERRKL